MSNDIISDINVKTLNYIKKCKQLKSSRNIILSKKYLKDHHLLAIPFDKGIGIWVMKKEVYHTKRYPQIAAVRENFHHQKECKTSYTQGREEDNKHSEEHESGRTH